VVTLVNVRSEKNLGMWGTVLVLVGGLIPYAGSVLALVGSSSFWWHFTV